MKDVTPGELLMLTLETMEDKKALEAKAQEDRNEQLDFDWDERYLDNLFTARFSNIKFNDSNLITYSKVGQYDPDMQDFSLDQLLVSLPDPVLEKLGFDVDKELVLQLSFGDYMYILSGGYGTQGGLRSGHVAGTGMATFGWWYLLILGLVVVPIFYLNDKFIKAKNPKTENLEESQGEGIKLSFCGILLLTSFFQFLLLESVVQGGTYLIRGWLQIVLLYFLVFHFSRIISMTFSGKKATFSLGKN